MGDHACRTGDRSSITSQQLLWLVSLVDLMTQSVVSNPLKLFRDWSSAFLAIKISPHQIFCYRDYSILAYAIHQELIQSVNQEVIRNYFITRYRLFRPRSALHTLLTIISYLSRRKSVKILCVLWALILSFTTAEGEKTQFLKLPSDKNSVR